MWTENIVNTVVIMVSFSRGGHEGDWVLHILAAEAMLPYFRSTGCRNYARYAAFYVHHTKGLDPVMLKKLTVWRIRAPHPRHQQLNVGRNNMHAAGPTGAIGVATDYLIW